MHLLIRLQGKNKNNCGLLQPAVAAQIKDLLGNFSPKDDDDDATHVLPFPSAAMSTKKVH